LLVDSFIAGQGGTLELGLGRMVFDRPEGLPKVDVAVRTAFGMIGVRGTKFFCGPSKTAFAVFVEHGSVSVEGAGVTRVVAAGEGVEFGKPGDAPTEPVNWGQARIAEAYASVGL
jgi:ferric-dicitrate binding protein FerR (iron transport regulator)